MKKTKKMKASKKDKNELKERLKINEMITKDYLSWLEKVEKECYHIDPIHIPRMAVQAMCYDIAGIIIKKKGQEEEEINITSIAQAFSGAIAHGYLLKKGVIGNGGELIKIEGNEFSSLTDQDISVFKTLEKPTRIAMLANLNKQLLKVIDELNKAVEEL